MESIPGEGTSVKFRVQLDQAADSIAPPSEWEHITPREMPSNVSASRIELPKPPPVAELTSLMDMALRGDLLGIEERAARIEEDTSFESFGRTLRQLANDFDDEHVIIFLEQYLA